MRNRTAIPVPTSSGTTVVADYRVVVEPTQAMTVGDDHPDKCPDSSEHAVWDDLSETDEGVDALSDGQRRQPLMGVLDSGPPYAPDLPTVRQERLR